LATESSKVVVRNARGEVLLVLREDLRTWALPGGGREPAETSEEAAVREAREETGYEVELDRYVGEYWRPQMPRGGDRQRLYLARVTGGDPSAHDWESVAVRWFAVDRLPRRLTPFCAEQIADALAEDERPVEKEQRLTWLQAALLRVFFLLRSARNRLLRRR
jgi:8-oxo-dGTP pyrophosphatase MutT (NUDIX family)